VGREVKREREIGMKDSERGRNLRQRGIDVKSRCERRLEDRAPTQSCALCSFVCV